MKVLVTGGSGFVGSHFLDALMKKGYKVANLDLRKPKKDNSDSTFWEAPHIQTNFCDGEGMTKILKFKPEIIFHIGAQARVNPSIEDPEFTFRTNVYGTFMVLEAARKLKAKFVYMSSDQAYGKPEKLPVDENHPFHPYNPYGASKAAGDSLVQGYSIFIPTLVIRPAMGFGSRSPPSQVTTKFFLKALEGKPLFHDIRVLENNSLSPTRDMCYITNIVQGVLLAVEKDVTGIYNIQSGKEISMLELSVKIAQMTGAEIVFSKKYKERPGELGYRYYGDVSKAKKDFGYNPEKMVSLERGLEKTKEWLLNNRDYFGSA